MAAAPRAENFVAFHAKASDSVSALAQLDQVVADLATASVPAAINNLRARRIALECQAALARAYEQYRLRRYEDALDGYRHVSKKILELIEPKFSRYKEPGIWPEGPMVTRAVTQVAAGLVTHIVPDDRAAPLSHSNHPEKAPRRVSGVYGSSPQ